MLPGATAVAAAGTIGFVGLIAPHVARALVGRRHIRVVPVAVLLGATLVCVADVMGRTVIAPVQLGAGLMTAIIGTPYFLYLLLRTLPLGHSAGDRSGAGRSGLPPGPTHRPIRAGGRRDRAGRVGLRSGNLDLVGPACDGQHAGRRL